MKRLIVNADEFGFTPGVNKGMMEAMESGIVTSTSAVANMPDVEDVTSLIGRLPHISIGIHFNLTVGRPVSPVGRIRSLVNGEGEFLRRAFVKRMLLGKIKMSEMVTELDAQVRRLIGLGVCPSHFDSHQNKHLYPMFFTAALEAAKRSGIKRMRSHNRYLFIHCGHRHHKIVRYYLTNPKKIMTHSFSRLMTQFARARGLRTPDRLISPAYADSSRKHLRDTWLLMAKTLPQGISEIYVHPGYADALLARYASYVKEREDEIRVLVSPEVRSALAQNNVELISFREI